MVQQWTYLGWGTRPGYFTRSIIDGVHLIIIDTIYVIIWSPPQGKWFGALISVLEFVSTWSLFTNNIFVFHRAMRERQVIFDGIQFCIIRGRGTSRKIIWGAVEVPLWHIMLRSPSFRVVEAIKMFINSVTISTLN